MQGKSPIDAMKLMQAMRPDPNKPLADRINWIAGELERTHETIRVLIQNNQRAKSEFTVLAELRDALGDSIRQHAAREAK